MSKVWLVTGSASGLGRNIAEAVLASGERLVATAFNASPAPVFPFERASYWDAQLLPYAAGNKGVFLCAGLTFPQGEATVSNNWNETLAGAPGPGWRFPHPNKSYGFNTWGVGVQASLAGANGLSFGLNTPFFATMNGIFGLGNGIVESAVVAPGDMIAIADYDPNYDNDGDGDHPDCLFSYCLTGNHHGGRANVVFCDAHVEYARTNAWAAPAHLFRTSPQPNGVRMRWNNDIKSTAPLIGTLERIFDDRRRG